MRKRKVKAEMRKERGRQEDVMVRKGEGSKDGLMRGTIDQACKETAAVFSC